MLAQPRSKRRKDFSRRTGWGPFQKGSACKRHRGMEKPFEERGSKVLVCGSAGPAPMLPNSGSGILTLLGAPPPSVCEILLGLTPPLTPAVSQ